MWKGVRLSRFQYVLRKRYGGRTYDNKLIEAFEHGKRYACPGGIPKRFKVVVIHKKKFILFINKYLELVQDLVNPILD